MSDVAQSAAVAVPAPSPTQVAPVLELRGLARRFGSHEVVRRLDLTVAPGERIALWGPNGSGKSTALRCVAGSLSPSDGTVLVCGRDPTSPAGRSRTGVSLAQERSFYLRLTGRQNLLFFARLRADSERAAGRAMAAVVDELEIGDIVRERLDRCSTGMVQQVALARALLGDPDLLVLDEPTRSLDAATRERLWAALDRRPAASVLIATHLEDDVARCDRRVDFPT